jgi:hypothetical protein
VFVRVRAQDVVNAAVLRKPMKAKSTNHMIRAGNGGLMPLVTISPNCALADDGINLTGGWSYTPAQAPRVTPPRLNKSQLAQDALEKNGS